MSPLEAWERRFSKSHAALFSTFSLLSSSWSSDPDLLLRRSPGSLCVGIWKDEKELPNEGLFSKNRNDKLHQQENELKWGLTYKNAEKRKHISGMGCKISVEERNWSIRFSQPLCVSKCKWLKDYIKFKCVFFKFPQRRQVTYRLVRLVASVCSSERSSVWRWCLLGEVSSVQPVKEKKTN